MSPITHDAIQQIGYWICAAAFLLAGLMSAISRLRGAQKWLIVTGCASTATWAMTTALTMAPARGIPLASAAEIVRDAAWIFFLVSVQGFGDFSRRLTGISWPLGLTVGTACIVAFAILAVNAGPSMWGAGGSAGSVYPELLLSIVALVLIENLYRNADVDGRWGIKALCIGLSLIFTSDFIFYSIALFAGGPSTNFAEGRGFVEFLAAPLLLLSVRRSASWRNDIQISRDAAFHSAVLLGGGLYLLTMAVLNTALHLVGGWPALQMTFVIATGLAVLVIFSSKSFRSVVRIYISKNFFSHKYDYRQVWLKFIRDISHKGQGRDLQHRIMHAVADIFDCPAGALWIRQPDSGSFVPLACWNLGDGLPPEPADGPLAAYLSAGGWIVDIAECRRHPSRYCGFSMPPWLAAHPRAWLLAPLIHNSKLYAFLVLGMPRAAIEIGWEELDLLRTVGEQAASYLAEEQASRNLVEATRMEEFNRWSAFLVHDIKGIVGQMSLLVANAEKHAHDHAFQRDVVSTVANAVLRMRKMLEQLNSGRNPSAARGTQIDAAALLRQVGDRWRRSIPSLQVADPGGVMLVEAREEALASVLDHLIQNAVEASGPEGRIRLGLRWHRGEGMLEVQDDGPGMDPTFVQDKLFKPLSSSKPNGFGLGAFQVRHLVRAMGGRLEVDTSPGVGTTMRVHLPIRAADGSVEEGNREVV